MKLNHTQDVASLIEPLSSLLVADHDLPASPRTLPLSTNTKTDLIQQGLAALKTCNFARPRSRALAASTRDNTASSEAQLALLLDSGASFHIHYLESDLTNTRPCTDKFEGVDRVKHTATCIGDLDVSCIDSAGHPTEIRIRNVRIFPDITDSLLSVSQLWNEGRVKVLFGAENSIVMISHGGEGELRLPFKERNGIFEWRVHCASRTCSPTRNSGLPQLLSGRVHDPRSVRPRVCFGNDATVRSVRSSSYFNEYSADIAAHHMHHRLHIGLHRLRNLPTLTSDAPPSLAHASGAVRCRHCTIANGSRHAHSGNAYKPSYPGRLIHADIAGRFVTSMSPNRNEWILILVDDHTRFKFVYPIRTRADAPLRLRTFVAAFNNMARTAQMQGREVRTIGTLLNDKAGEFVSNEFREFLAGNLVQQVNVPAEIHGLNGVAERAVRSVTEQCRSMMVASNAPKGLWDYAVIQACDILNRTTTPPGSSVSCYEMMTGERPRILNILPFGCRLYVVRPRQGNKKSEHYSRAQDGINLGRSEDTRSSYCVWIPSTHRVMTSSDVYHDETLMPWRPVGDQRISDPAPIPVPADDGQPIGLPLGEDPGAPPAPLNSLEAEFHRLASTAGAGGAAAQPELASSPASLSRHILVLFSGPKERPDGLMVFLRRLGFSVTPVDNDPKNGGGKDDDILRDAVYENLLRLAQRGRFFAIFAAPPCSTFSVARLIRSTQSPDGGPPPIRTRLAIRGLPKVPPQHRRELTKANAIVARTSAILHAAAESGSEFIIENPADRGDPSNEELFVDHEHAPIWLMPEIINLEKKWSCRKVTFPQCAFGARVLKHTTLMYTPALDKSLADFDNLKCTSTAPLERAGGSRNADGTWNSAATAAYPAEMNLAIAQCFAVAAGTQHTLRLPLPEDPGSKINTEAPGGNITSLERSDRSAQPDSSTAIPSDARPILRGGDLASRVRAQVQADMGELPSGSTPNDEGESARDQELEPDNHDPDESEDNEDELDHAPETPSVYPHRYPTRYKERVGASQSVSRALIAVGKDLAVTVDATRVLPGNAEALPDPKNRREAMAMPDHEGWVEAEGKELDNHKRNGSFHIMERSAFYSEAYGRKLVRLTWAYKRKRSGALKARLCVQGCSQIPGVDYDQTFCGAMRATSLRLLCALASHLGLKMRRFDFVSAFLQGSLEDGEVVYCEPPPGYNDAGKDGRTPVYKVLKPVYGMAQAGRRWQRSLFPWLIDPGPTCGNLTQSESDPSVFFATKAPSSKQSSKGILIVGVYVDDLFILYSDDDSLYCTFISRLEARWDVEDEGEVSDLLNVEISRSSDGYVTLRQTAYIDKLVTQHAPSGIPDTSQRNKIPCDPTLPQLVLDAVTSGEDPTPAVRTKYMSLVGALLYCATHTRPDITYAVGMLARAMHCPNPLLCEAALRVLYYLYRTRMLGLRYAPCEDAQFYGMSDSDWATKHSTSGAVFMLSGAAVSWTSKRQATIALSSCEAEIMAASEAAKETIYLDGFLKELNLINLRKTPELFVDNTAARDLAYNPQHHDRTKHIARRHFFIRELVENGRIAVPYVKSIDNLADFFTKPLPSSVFTAMRDKVMNLKDDFPVLSRDPPPKRR